MSIIYFISVGLLFFYTYFFNDVPLIFRMDGNYEFEYPILSLIVSVVKIITSSFPILIIFLIANIVFITSVGKISNRLIPTSLRSKKIWRKLIVTLLVISLIEFTFTNYFFLDHIPHVPDSIAYATQAKMFAMGKLYLGNLPFPEHFALPGMILHDGKWFSQYTFGHPLILSLGYLINIPWIIPPFIGTLGILFMYLIGKELYSARIGFFVAFLAFTSPFFKMNAVNYMSHNSALTVTLIFTYLFIKMIRTNNLLFSFLAGISIGFLVNIRPYTALLIFMPFLIYILFVAGHQIKQKRYKLKKYIFFFLGLVIMIFLYGYYNFLLTGNFFQSPYSLGSTSSFGFSSTRSINDALYDTYINFFLLNKVLVGLPLGMSFMFIIIYFLTPIKNKLEFIFIGIISFIILGYFMYEGSWIMYGPRFWYEMIPFLFFLIVIGVERVPIFICKIFPNFLRYKNLNTKSLVFSYSIIIYLCLNSLTNWYSFSRKNPSRWYSDYTPENINELENFDFVNTNLIKNIEHKKINNAVIFIKQSSNLLSYGVPAYHMNLSLKDTIIYVRDLGDNNNKRIINIFPSRNYYKGDYDSGLIEQYLK